MVKNMKKLRKEMKIVTIIIFVIMVLIGTFFIYNFYQQYVSQSIEHWGYFGSFCDGVLGTLLTILNIYLFFRLTETAANFGKKSSWTQICHSVLQEYQNNINRLTLDFLRYLELYKEACEDRNEKQNRYLQRAKDRLTWILYLADCFCDEAKTVLSNEEMANEEFENAKDRLSDSVQKLEDSNIINIKTLKAFLDAKSNFINVIIKELKYENEES